MKNTCYTYFLIKGDFLSNDITNILGLKPNVCWDSGDLRKDQKSKYNFSVWKYGQCDQYNVEFEILMKETIKSLIPKIKELNEIRTKYDVSFVLEVVPEIYRNETTPVFNPGLEVIDFCHATRTEIDYDYYIMD